LSNAAGCNGPGGETVDTRKTSLEPAGSGGKGGKKPMALKEGIRERARSAKASNGGSVEPEVKSQTYVRGGIGP